MLEAMQWPTPGYSGNVSDGLYVHIGIKFTKKEEDNSIDGGNCVISFKSG